MKKDRRQRIDNKSKVRIANRKSSHKTTAFRGAKKKQPQTLEAKKNPEKKIARSKNKFLFLIGIILAIVLFIYLPVFRIDKIEINNLKEVEAVVVYSHSSIEDGQHFLKGLGGDINLFFSARYGKAEERVLQSVPEIKNITIRYDFPRKVVFEVEERVAIGWIKIPDGYCTVDGQGIVISISQFEPDNLPIISGMTVTKANLGHKIEVLQNDYLENALKTMTALIEADILADGKKLLHSIERIEPTINDDIYLYIDFPEQELSIICDKSCELKEDFIWLKELFSKEIILNKGSGTIDLRGQQRIFKPKEAN